MNAVVQSIGDLIPSPTVSTDWDDLRRAAAGDGEAFRGIVERHQDRLLRLCQRFLGSREEAEDAVQEVFVKAYRKASSYQPRGQLYTWLYRIAVNHCLNVLRRRRLVRFLRLSSEPDDVPLEVPDRRPDAVRELEARWRWQQTRRWIDELPLSQRAVLLLARFEGLSYKENAEQLNITVGAVERHSSHKRFSSGSALHSVSRARAGSSRACAAMTTVRSFSVPT